MKKTPLNALHRRLGARMVDFGGWDMPVRYSGIAEEHMAVRERVGLFDVSHMGEIFVHGKGALEQIQRVTTNDASKLKPGQIQYSGLMTERGTFVDDVLVHKFSDERYFLCVNASNQDKDFEWFLQHSVKGAKLENKGADFAQIAVQGPFAEKTLQKLTDTELSPIGYYHFAEGKVLGQNAILSRTGYTGEDGFEVYIVPEKAEALWEALTEAGKEFGILPCGLGARDTLRLEAGMALYGNDIDDTTTPYEADLAWIVRLGKSEFLGKDVLVRQKETGVTTKLVAFEMLDRGIARHGHDVYVGGEKAGRVTSGTRTPYVKKAIGLAALPTEVADVGNEFEVDVRGKRLRAQVIEKPPYKREK